MLNAGAHINIRDQFNKTPLHEAVVINEATFLLMHNGADFNAQDDRGNTPFMNLVYTRHDSWIKGVLEHQTHKINFGLKNKDGHTALSLAKKLVTCQRDPDDKRALEMIIQRIKQAQAAQKKSSTHERN